MKRKKVYHNLGKLIVIMSLLILPIVQVQAITTVPSNQATNELNSEVGTNQSAVESQSSSETNEIQTEETLSETEESGLTGTEESIDSISDEPTTSSTEQGEPTKRNEDKALPEGPAIVTNQYVTITNKNYTIFENFAWKIKENSKKLVNQTFHVLQYFEHSNGEKYYSLYNDKDVWQGYIKETDVTVAPGPQGIWLKSTDYVTVTHKNYNIWNNFNWHYRMKSSSIYQKTYQAKGYYNHVNGSKYYTLYDSKGIWKGYLNAVAVTVAPGPQGIWIKANDYLTVTNKNYNVWNNFNWHYRMKSSSIYQKTYLGKGYYNHFNGSKYYSLYNNAGKWQGYLSANAVTVAPGAQGIWLKNDEHIVVTNKYYNVWSNFNWKYRMKSSVLYNKTYQAKGYYNHFNGSKYYSLYDSSNRWQGYLSANAVRVKPNVSSYLGTSKAKVLDELTKHGKDSFYLGTPYRRLSGSNNPAPARVMSPRGNPNGYGPGMNCTGFVAYVLQKTGGKMTNVTQVANAWGGMVNAYNWRDALMAKTRFETFNSVNDLLKSGKASKGDILYFEPDRSVPNYDCHIGFFWGDKSNENKMWHSAPNVNKISTIYSVSKISKVYLFKL